MIATLDIIQVIEGCKKHEQRSQKILYERFFGYALKIAFRYVYRYDTAMDVTNDGFVKIFRHIARFRYDNCDFPERRLMAWIKRIIVNTSIDEIRKPKMDEPLGIPEYVWDKTDIGHNADQMLLYKELIGHIKSLPPMYRLVFNMFVIDECSHVEIAERLGISVGTSKSNLSRAKAIMKNLIRAKDAVNLNTCYA